MTIKQTLATIRAMGLGCTWSPEWQEYRIFFPEDRKNLDKGSYASDSHEAILTANDLVHWRDNVRDKR